MTSCSDHHPITHQGQPVILACTIDHGHTGAHQAYYADRLHEWPTPQPPLTQSRTTTKAS